MSSKIQHIHVVPPRSFAQRETRSIAYKYRLRSALYEVIIHFLKYGSVPPPHNDGFDGSRHSVFELSHGLQNDATSELANKVNQHVPHLFRFIDRTKGCRVSLVMHTHNIFFVVSGVNTKIEGGYIYYNQPPLPSCRMLCPCRIDIYRTRKIQKFDTQIDGRCVLTGYL
jgi:hypothetical protein